MRSNDAVVYLLGCRTCKFFAALITCLCFAASPLLAQSIDTRGVIYPVQNSETPRRLAEIRLHSVDELTELLHRAEQWFDSEDYSLWPASPVTFLLHGNEGKVFLRENYRQHKTLVDLAARLSALNVVDIKVCETWMGEERLDPTTLLPFVSTVPSGVTEVERLLRDEAYIYF